jgi:hypothetical protein
MEALANWLSVKLGVLLGGFFGALVSLKFVAALGQMTVWQRSVTVMSGWGTAVFLTPLSIEAMELTLSDRSHAGIAFVIGLFGLSVAAAALENLPKIIESLRQKFIG